MAIPEVVPHFPIRAVTGKLILYVGMGEKLSDLEQFLSGANGKPNPWNGDVLCSDREGAGEMDEDKAKEMSKKMKSPV